MRSLDLNSLHRIELAAKLKTLGIKDPNVIAAIGKVKRELFVKEEFKKYSYDNIALPLDMNQTISQPFTVAFMTELLEIQNGDRVLEIGTGSGYQAAVLTEMGADVYSVERIPELYEMSRNRLSLLNYDAHLKCDDGTKGWIEYAPFDKIIVTAGSPRIPKQLLQQLKMNGRMIIPVGDESSQKLFLIKKTEDNETGDEEAKYKFKAYEDFKFVPLIGEEGWIE